MSLFQCEKCGCCENTALTNASRGILAALVSDDALLHKSYCEVLGIEPGSKLGNYCSACTPLWFDKNGDCGFGQNPTPTEGAGLWHGRFPRDYYPLGFVHTDNHGNLAGPGLARKSSQPHPPAAPQKGKP